MAFKLQALLLAGGLLGGLAGPALSQSASADPDQARLEWAKRHLEVVCDSYDRPGQRQLALKCYGDVARIVGDPSLPLPASVTAQPGATVTPPARPVVRAPAPSPRRPAVAPAASNRVAAVRRRVVSSPRPTVASLRAAIDQRVLKRCDSILCPQYTLLGVGF